MKRRNFVSRGRVGRKNRPMNHTSIESRVKGWNVSQGADTVSLKGMCSPFPSSGQLESLGKVTLAGVMCGHLKLTNLQPNVFFAPVLPE